MYIQILRSDFNLNKVMALESIKFCKYFFYYLLFFKKTIGKGASLK